MATRGAYKHIKASADLQAPSVPVPVPHFRVHAGIQLFSLLPSPKLPPAPGLPSLQLLILLITLLFLMGLDVLLTRLSLFSTPC